MSPIPYGKHHITKEDIEEVEKVLKSDYLTQGPKVKEFEENFAEYIGSKYAVAVANGTGALHLSVLAMKVKPGDKVITTPITFAATANSILYAGGEVDFVDIDPETYLMDLDKLEHKLENAPEGTYKGIIPVDFAGYPVDMIRIKEIADRYGLWIIEDASHAPGAYFLDSYGKKNMAGNASFSELAIFSFHPVKHIAAAEGGMITTNNEKLYEHLQLLRTHGITKNPKDMNEYHGGWYYEMIELGFNYRLSEIHAALGLSQLKRANERLNTRNQLAKKYTEAFKGSSIITSFVQDNIYHAFHLYVIQIQNRKDLYDYLVSNGVHPQVHYIPLHLQPYYREKGWKKGDFPEAETYYERCLSLPMYPSLTDPEQRYVIDKVLEYII
jgi:UDP-4-amino-4,6-dideoxy-N-acetyl-beta-L-altrosamine transaminase